MDLALFLPAVMLAIIGIAAQYSAANGMWHPWAAKQCTFLAIAMIISLTVAQLDDHSLYNCAYRIYLASTVLLLAVVAMGATKMGATRWLNVGYFNFQPSELAKLTTILALVRYLCANNIGINSPVIFFIAPMLIALVPTVLVFVQPHLGNSLLILCTALVVICASGFPTRAIVAGIILVSICLPVAWHFLLHSYQKVRITAFLNPNIDPLGAGYNVIQAKIAAGSGGLMGKGFLNGSQTHLGFLPEKHTDFIFTIIAEELGFCGCMVVIALYVLLIGRLVLLSYQANHLFRKLTILGIAVTIFIQVLVNTFMSLGLMPVVGVPLPFVSYGGSSLLMAIISVGVGMSLSANQGKPLRSPRTYLYRNIDQSN